MITFFKSGNRVFTVATLLTLGAALAHMTGLNNEPFNDDWAAAIEAMRTADIDIGPVKMTFHNLFIGLWLQVGVLLALLGVKNLVVLLAMPKDRMSTVIRALSIVDCVTYAGLTALFAVYPIPPALISFAILTVVYLAAAIWSSGSNSE